MRPQRRIDFCSTRTVVSDAVRPADRPRRAALEGAVIDLLARLTHVRKNGSGWTARCPGHEDRQNSLSIGQGKDGRWLLKCHAGCDLGQITAALGIDAADLFDKQSKGEGGVVYPPGNSALVQQTQPAPEPAGMAQSIIRHRGRLLELPAKDPSALHVEDPGRFAERWRVACLSAMPWTAVEAEANAGERAEAWNTCQTLAQRPDILEVFADELKLRGLAGERDNAKLVYLALTSRLLDRPVSLIVKGPSSGGKSFMVESVLAFFPPAAFYALSAMSERALAYSNEPLSHRHLILFEVAGMGPFATYLIRSLLSEGCLNYETVEKTKTAWCRS